MSGLSDPRVIYGVHSFSPYKRTDGKFYGTAKVVKGTNLSLEGELVELVGGSQKYPFAVEEGAIKSEVSFKFSQYEDFLIELFLGKAPTSNSAEASGNVSTLTNKLGTSAQKATTGIASIAAKSGSEADLKFGKYVVVVASATTVDIYFSSDADISRGNAGAYQNDALKVTATPLTVPSGTTVDVPNFGLQLTGGSGTIGMTTGDTATFEVRPINTGSMTVIVGGASDSFPEFGCILMAQKRGNQEMTEIDLFRCKGAGLPIGFDAKAFSEADVKVKIFYDSAKNGVFEIRTVKAS